MKESKLNSITKNLIKHKKIYLMRNDFDLFKIGVSVNPKRRRSEIERNSGTPTYIIKEIETKTNPYIVETALHKRFEKFRKSGEFFTSDILPLFDKTLSEEQSKILDKIKAEENNLLKPIENSTYIYERIFFGYKKTRKEDIVPYSDKYKTKEQAYNATINFLKTFINEMQNKLEEIISVDIIPEEWN